MSEGYILLKCRLCGVVEEALAANVRDELFRKGSYSSTNLHCCSEGRYGIADVIGGREDPEEPA